MDSAGYLTEIAYTHGYYREIGPPLLRFACLSAGVEPPAISRYLELGCGHGVSLAIHAAANEGEFWGNDFHPEHVAYAKAMPSPATVLPDSFAELAARDLPDFDAIVLHGIWSWVSAESRRVIIDLVHRRLKPGGLVYVSYNCLAGWAPAIPLRHLMREHGTMEATGDTAARVRGALAFAERLAAVGVSLPDLEKLRNSETAYVASEYFGDNWDVSGSAEVARAVGLPFIGSANVAEHVDGINLTPDGIRLLADTPEPLRQTVRDMLMKQKFRKDIFVKEPRALAPDEWRSRLDAQRFVLSHNPEAVPLAVDTSLGRLGLREDIYRPLLRQMPCPFGDIALPFEQKLEAVRILTAAAVLHLAQPPSESVIERCTTLNRYLRTRPEVEFRASPITGSGIYSRAANLAGLGL